MRLYSFLLKQITPSKPVHTATCYLNTCCRSRSRDYSDSVNCSRLSELFLSLLRQVLEYIFKILFFLKSLLKSPLFSCSIKLIRRSIVNGAAALVQVLGQLPENKLRVQCLLYGQWQPRLSFITRGGVTLRDSFS